MIRPTPAEEAPPPAVAERRNTIPDAVWERQRAQHQRKLERDLDAERARLAREQDKDLRSKTWGPGADEVRKRHTAEQQAFEEHATQMRQVWERRMQKQLVKSDKARSAGKPNDKRRGKDKGEDPGGG